MCTQGIAAPLQDIEVLLQDIEVLLQDIGMLLQDIPIPFWIFQAWLRLSIASKAPASPSLEHPKPLRASPCPCERTANASQVLSSVPQASRDPLQAARNVLRAHLKPLRAPLDHSQSALDGPSFGKIRVRDALEFPFLAPSLAGSDKFCPC